MVNLQLHTKLSAVEVMDRLRSFFGKGGLGLEITEENPQCLTFEGGGGYVTAIVCPEGEKTRIDLQSREWDHQVRQFASDVG